MLLRFTDLYRSSQIFGRYGGVSDNSLVKAQICKAIYNNLACEIVLQKIFLIIKYVGSYALLLASCLFFFFLVFFVQT